MTDQGPRRITRHAFLARNLERQYPGGLSPEQKALNELCAFATCRLPYEAPVHWILDEVVTPLEDENPVPPEPDWKLMDMTHQSRDKGWNRVNEPERETPRPKVRVDTSYFNPLKPDDDEQAVVEAKLRVAFERWRAHSAAIDKNLGGDAECGNPAHLLEELRRQGLRLVLK